MTRFAARHSILNSCVLFFQYPYYFYARRYVAGRIDTEYVRVLVVAYRYTSLEEAADDLRLRGAQMLVERRRGHVEPVGEIGTVDTTRIIIVSFLERCLGDLPLSSRQLCTPGRPVASTG